MAYKRIQTIGRYEGMSTDIKPTDDIKEGSQLHEIDTGKRFILMDGNWQEEVSGPISELVFNAAHSVARRIAEDDSPEKKFEFYPDSGHYNFIERR